MRIVLGQNRCKGITVFGAISSSLNRAVFAQEESTNGEAFTRFLGQLRTRFLIGYPKLYVVIDNAPAHRTLVNRQRAADLKIELLFMPPYSPELNSIESLWSVIKRDFKQRALDNVMFKMDQTQFSDLLQKSLDAVTPMQQSRAARQNNREYVERCLGDLIRSRRHERQVDRPEGVEAIDVESEDGQETFDARYPPNEGCQQSSQIEASDCDRTHTYQQVSPRVDGGFVYHFEPVVVAEEVKERSPLAL